MAEMIKDNSSNPNWPEVTVIGISAMVKTMRDREPYQQKITLSCGHWCFNTWGDRERAIVLNQKLRCRTCGVSNG